MMGLLETSFNFLKNICQLLSFKNKQVRLTFSSNSPFHQVFKAAISRINASVNHFLSKVEHMVCYKYICGFSKSCESIRLTIKWNLFIIHRNQWTNKLHKREYKRVHSCTFVVLYPTHSFVVRKGSFVKFVTTRRSYILLKWQQLLR